MRYLCRRCQRIREADTSVAILPACECGGRVFHAMLDSEIEGHELVEDLDDQMRYELGLSDRRHP